MSFEYPQDLRYLDSHEYVRIDGDIATIGITQFALEQLGDILHLELPDIGDAITKGEGLGTIESVRSVETLNSPVTGTVIERNDPLIDSLEDIEDIAEEIYREGWFVKVRVNDPGEVFEDTLTADEYSALVEGV